MFVRRTLGALSALAVLAAAPCDAAPSAVDLTFTLPLRNAAELEQLVALQADPRSPEYHHFLTRAQFRARYGPTGATVARVAADLAAHGLPVIATTTQSLHVRGSVGAVNAAFRTQLIARSTRSGSGMHLVAASRLALDPVLRGAGVSVTGIAARPASVFDFTRVALPQNRYSAAGPYWFDDLKQAYDYPAYASAAGAGATIAIVISSDISDSDLAAYFGNERFSAISGAPVPSVIRRPVLGGAPFDPTSDASLEASVDVQQSLGSAPGARLVLYDIPDQYDDAILAGYTDVVEDDAADVVSSSFGACEQLYTAAYNGGDDETGYLHAEHDLFLQGNAQGQTFVAASGDNAALGCPSLSYFFTGTGIFQKGIQAPASDPDVTAVGGTNLVTASKPGKLDAQYVSENAIGNKIEPEDLYGIGRGTGASGGVFGSGSGASVIWPKPAYQKLLATGAPTRAIPDVSMHMGGCPEFSLYACPPTDSAAVVILGGSAYGVIGTSLSAPEFAGLLALRVAAFGERLGNVNPSLYELAVANDALPYHEYHTRIAGFNGFVTVSDAPRAYNPIIGLGTPYAKNFIGLPNVQSAGTPQTLTNP